MARRNWPAILIWLATRALTLHLLFGAEHLAVGDPEYYRINLRAMSHVGVAHTLVEYPVPAVALLAVPYLLVHLLGHLITYSVALALCALAMDATLGVLLVVGHRQRPDIGRVLGLRPAEWVWLAAVPAMGATALARFDLIPGVLVALALLFLAARPRLAAVCAAVATATKYWPAIVLPALLGPARSRRAVAVTTVLSGGAIAVASALWGGWHRLLTPLSYLQDRGLQVESVTATPAMLRFALHPGSYRVVYAPSHAFEVEGPKVGALLRITTLETVALALLLLVLWMLIWRRLAKPGADLDPLVWVVLASVAGFIVTGKVLSPQYLLWLLPPAAAGLLLLRDAASRRRLFAWSGALVAVTLATQYIFPLHYVAVVAHTPRTLAIVTLLAVRNLSLVALFVYAVSEAWLLCREPTPTSEHPIAVS